MKRETDFLIIGSGAAGLSLALKVADYANVIVITKSDMSTTNTEKAQGGIAAVMYEPEDIEQHIKDTIICGSYECNEEVVRMVVSKAPTQIRQLIQWGVDFDKTKGKYDLHREGGHTRNRILHHKDCTGAEIQRALVYNAKKHKNITILEHCFAVELLTQHHLGKLITKHSTDTECYGAYVLNNKTNEVSVILSKVTIIATGGVGNIYQTTTNPAVATGDGIAMVHRAKGVVERMEFLQFHPTSLYNPSERPSFLISEAMRGFGAILRTRNGEEFMNKYHEMGSLAPRDVVARSMDTELKISGDEYLYLDVTHKSADDIKSHFPNIYNKCLDIGIDITIDMIPVVPAAHYSCGGIKVDLNGETSIDRLYAIGESSSTGLHGANRLASNSLSEAVVYADNVALHALPRTKEIKLQQEIPAWNFEGTSRPEEMILVTQSYKELQQIMSNYVGIVRSNTRLERAMARLGLLYEETERLFKEATLSQKLCELRNMIAVAYIIIKQAKEMKHSVGLHYTLDYPQENGIKNEF